MSWDLLYAATVSVLTHVALRISSGYFLIMLNSALMFYAVRRWFSQAPVAQERVLYYLFTVLGLADCEHYASCLSDELLTQIFS